MLLLVSLSHVMARLLTDEKNSGHSSAVQPNLNGQILSESTVEEAIEGASEQ